MTMEEDRFKQAFNTLRSEKRLKPIDFARRLGVGRSYVSNALNDNQSQGRHIPVSWFAELCRYGVSAEWLLLGKGNMFNNQTTLL